MSPFWFPFSVSVIEGEAVSDEINQELVGRVNAARISDHVK